MEPFGSANEAIALKSMPSSTSKRFRKSSFSTGSFVTSGEAASSRLATSGEPKPEIVFVHVGRVDFDETFILDDGQTGVNVLKLFTFTPITTDKSVRLLVLGEPFQPGVVFTGNGRLTEKLLYCLAMLFQL